MSEPSKRNTTSNRTGAPDKTSKMASPARMLALKATRAIREREAYASNIIESMVMPADLSESDRSFASLLVYGVVATAGTLDQIIDDNVDSPKDIKPRLRDALRIPVYEMTFLHKEAYASVSQGVDLVASDMPRARGLANVVLRRVADDVRGFPWGDPATDDKALARLHGYPLWMMRRIAGDRGWTFCRNMLEATDAPAPLFVATNLFRADDDTVQDALSSIDAKAEPYGVPGCIKVTDEASVVRSDLFNRGAIVASDAASQLVASLVASTMGTGHLLEVGAGRGTKSILIQNDVIRRCRAEGKPDHFADITALDIHGFKEKVLQNRLKALGIPGVTSVTGDATLIGTAEGPLCAHTDDSDRIFDAAFIDAPCSGLGTLRRHPEERWRMTEDAIGELADTGFKMLQATSRVLRNGASLVYSTCTPLIQEDEDVIERFLSCEEGSEFSIDPIVPDALAPQFADCVTAGGFFLSTPRIDGPDGHFAARLIRDGGRGRRITSGTAAVTAVGDGAPTTAAGSTRG